MCVCVSACEQVSLSGREIERERERERERYRIAVLHFSSAFNEFPFQLMLYTIGIVVGAAAVAAALLQQQQQRVH